MKKPRESKRESGKSSRKKSRFAVIVVAVIFVSFIVMVFFPSKTSKNGVVPPNPATLFHKQGELTFLDAGDKVKAAVDIEIAEDEFKREVGLMDRPTMEQNQGMLFVFQEERPVGFWMKNTILSLDMIFVNSRGEIVTIHKNTTPFSEQTYPADRPVLFVLEVNAGFTDMHNVVVGDKIRWERK